MSKMDSVTVNREMADRCSSDPSTGIFSKNVSYTRRPFSVAITPLKNIIATNAPIMPGNQYDLNISLMKIRSSVGHGNTLPFLTSASVILGTTKVIRKDTTIKPTTTMIAG